MVDAFYETVDFSTFIFTKPASRVGGIKKNEYICKRNQLLSHTLKDIMEAISNFGILRDSLLGKEPVKVVAVEANDEGKGDQRALRHRGGVGCPGRSHGQARRGTGHHEGNRKHRRAAESRAQQRGGAATQGGRHLAHLGHQAAHLPQAAVRHRRGRHPLPHARAAPCDDTVCRQHLQGVWHHAA